MELLTVSIPILQRDHNPIVVAPLGDIQWNGDRGPTAKDTLQRYLDKALDLVLELYEKFLKPTKGRWLGMLHGHHYAVLQTGETTDQRLCQLLGTRFLGTSAYIRLQFQTRACRHNVVLWAHHGCGGGQTIGAPLNKLENIAACFPSADVYIMGHTTKQPAAPLQRVVARWHGRGAPDLVDKTVYIVNSGGFALGYQKGSTRGKVPMGGYVEKALMKPAALGAPLIRIVPRLTFIRGNNGRYNNGDWSPEISVEI